MYLFFLVISGFFFDAFFVFGVFLVADIRVI